MSITGPNVFVTVGDTDWLTVQYAHTDIGLDSRLLGYRRESNDASWRSIVGGNTRNPTTGMGYYCEVDVITSNADTGGNTAGLILSGSESTIQTALVGNVAGSASYHGAGWIYLNAALVQTGLTTAVAGNRIGVRLYRESGTLKAQFYINGTAVGTAVTLTDGSYKFAASMYYLSTAYRLHVDRDDLRYLSSMPTGTQPWGASARVADAGGYSPINEGFGQGSLGAGSATDTNGRVITSSDNTDTAFACSSNRTGSKLYYVEYLLHTEGAAGSLLGVCNTSAELSATNVGGDANGWGYFSATGDRYTNNVATAGYATYTSGARIGVIYQPSTGKIWFLKDGTVQGGGNPEAGTSSAYTVSGDIRPGVSPRSSGRVRICTHAREQLYRPVYCEAWGGSNLLPEQHYKGLLGNDPYIEQGVWFPVPWGGDKSGSPVGAIEILNLDGDYDALSDYNLRNQRVAVDRLWAGETTPEAEARAIVSSVEIDGEKNLRVLTDDVMSKLDVRSISGPIPLGKPLLIPARGVDAASLRYEVGGPATHGILFGSGGAMLDNGLAVTTFRHLIRSDFRGFVRTVAPAGKQSLKYLQTYALEQTQTGTFTNGGFTAWTADNPDSWTVVETAPSNIVTQNGSACRLLRGTGGAPTVSISQNIGAGSRIVKIIVSAYVSGRIAVAGTSSYDLEITGTGTYYIFHNGATLTISAAEGTDLTIDDVSPLTYYTLTTDGDVFKYLLEALGGLASTDWSNTWVRGEVIGTYFEQEATARQMLFAIAAGTLVCPYVDPAGIIRFARLTVPGGYTSSDSRYRGAITLADFRGPMEVRDDLAPALTTQIAYAMRFVTHSDNEIAGAVSNADRSVLTAPYNTTTLTGLHPFYAHASNAPPQDSHCVTVPTNTPTEISTAYDQRCRFYTVDLDAAKVRRWCPGDFVDVSHVSAAGVTRFGLSQTQLFVVGLSKSAKSPVVRATLWGPKA